METDLVVRAQLGDQRAFARLAGAIYARLHGIAHGLLRDVMPAEDAVQVALLALWRDLRQQRDPQASEAWSYRILVRACDAASRRSRRWLPTLAGAVGDGPPIEGGFAAVADRDRLERGFRRLTVEQREVVVLHHDPWTDRDGRVGPPVEGPAGTIEIASSGTVGFVTSRGLIVSDPEVAMAES